MWDASTRDSFDRWFDALGKTAEGREAQVEIAAAVKVLRQIGPTLGRPTVDTLKGSKHANMKELRVSTAAVAIRIAFAFDPLQRAILLVGGDKHGIKQQRFYKTLITKADKEYDDHHREIQGLIAAKREATEAERAKVKGKKKGG